MTPEEKVRENRLRRMAARRGLKLEKYRARDPGAIDYGTYRIMDANDTDGIAVYNRDDHEYGLTLDQVEEILGRYTP